MAAQLGYLRLSGYKLVLERHGLRSKVHVVNPATGAIAATIPERHPGKLFGGGVGVQSLLASANALPAPGAPPELDTPAQVREVLLALALRDETVNGAEAVDLADRALPLASGEGALDPPAALEAAKRARLEAG